MSHAFPSCPFPLCGVQEQSLCLRLQDGTA
jgi:hypothetical protein